MKREEVLPGEVTLMLYPESQHGHLTVRNGPDRLALNHGMQPLLSELHV